MFKRNIQSVRDNIGRSIKQCPLFMNLGGWIMWISLVECSDHIRCILQVFRWLPTCCIGGVVKSFPLDQVKQARSFVPMIDPTVQDPMDFPFVGVVQLDWWWGCCGPVGDLTTTSGL